MMKVFIPDVGHGLAAGLTTISGKTVQIDCGTLRDSEKAYKRGLNRIHPDIFFLSHYHQDHYNGLTQAPNSEQKIEKVRFPKIPEWESRQKFLKALLATQFLSSGHQTGVWPADLYQSIRRINNIKFSFEPVSQGDYIHTGSTKFEVLWPPKELPDSARALFSRSVKKFNKALKQDDLLKRIAEHIEEQDRIEPYLSGKETEPDSYDDINILNDIELAVKEREAPKITKEARENLQDAADQMSLAVHMDNHLLFMGDAKERFIKQIVEQLLEKEREHFHMIITPHHGTRWDDTLRQLSAEWVVSSIGQRYQENLQPEFKSICNHNWVTLWNGELLTRMSMIQDPRQWRYITK